VIQLFKRPFVRSVERDNLLEVFLVTAVTSVLCIRFFLAVTGYPQLSGRGLHVAHVLVGGVFMMVALVILLAYINKSAFYVGAVLGGFGFGAFIDEVGKFITQDNNYFFQPAVALIYVAFILIYLTKEVICRGPALSEQEKLINVLEITKEAVLNDMDFQERKRALELVGNCSASEPVARVLKELLYGIDSVPVPEPGVYARIKNYARSFYDRMVQKKWFVNVVIVFFVLQSIFTLIVSSMVLILLVMAGGDGMPILHFSDVGGLVASAAAAILVAAGVMKIRKRRLVAYNYFRNAILVQILLVQVFVFYKEQLAALTSLAVNIVVLLVLRYMISQEDVSQICR